ncbi:hypothetical protein M1M25_gp003 [Tenacibaculum phage Gundel_1]|uniref:Uncharacterized protein n=1 Tax=Tenacibaculum phage Gundel_1 TaxID=2745672 RepID=A0A8E4ZDX1_9CAUD|nr:hypothetical protein M1M25_gp003 [Tenacibaculum phage Gundel_1]QQV91461.1 hypothetical protein Gundel1_3 [Tenacibaculum phage Gundel_1]
MELHKYLFLRTTDGIYIFDSKDQDIFTENDSIAVYSEQNKTLKFANNLTAAIYKEQLLTILN